MTRLDAAPSGSNGHRSGLRGVIGAVGRLLANPTLITALEALLAALLVRSPRSSAGSEKPSEEGGS